MAKNKAKASKSAPKPAKISAAAKIRSKSEVFSVIAEHNQLTRKQVAGVFDTLGALIAVDLKGKSREFAVPGMMKIKSIYKPASKGGQRPNPFKPGEMMEVKPRPARNVIKIRPLKALKSMV